MGIKRDAADAAFSDCIRFAKSYRCEHCGKNQGQMECAHIFGRANKSVRWDTLNALCLCHYCHRVFTAEPVAFTRWLEGYVGAGYLEILNEKKNRIQKTTAAYRKEVAKHYRQQLRIMQAGRHELESFQ